MKTMLFCFSATGNSLASAKDIASRLTGDVQILSIAAHIRQQNQAIDADRVGFLFPVHAWGVPSLVRRCIESLSMPANAYIFAITTCGGTPGGTMGQLKKLLSSKGLQLQAGFSVAYDSQMLGTEKGFIKMVKSIAGKPSEKWSKRIDEICGYIERKEKRPLEQSNIQTRIIGNFMHKMASGMFAQMDKIFFTNEQCVGCQTCVKICPVANISMDNKNLSWNHQCLQCFACVNWCPKSAIEIGEESKGQPRYHNASVTLAEMLKFGKKAE
jgi:ferredoxin